MTILSVHKLEKNFGERCLFHDITFDVGDRDKIGLVGDNGCGKTTLFRMITGEIPHDAGEVVRTKDTRIGYMEQHACADASRTLWDEVESVFSPLIAMENELAQINHRLSTAADTDLALIERQHQLQERFEADGGLYYKSRVRSTLIGLGFDEAAFGQPVSTLSGGQRSKAAMGRLLLSDVNVLLLDEPTNHLDIASVEWLEEFLRAYSGAAVIISHDRYFLDRVTNRTIELSHGKLYTTNGNYSQHKETRAHDQEVAEKHYKTAMRDIQHVESSIAQLKQFNREKSIRAAESKEKMLERMKAQLEIPEAMQETIHFDFRAAMTSGNEVLNAEGLAMGFGSRQLFRNAAFSLRRGERVFLLGPNGCGKTTMLKIINGQLSPQRGTVRLGAKVSIGYYDQTQAGLDNRKTVIETVWDRYPALTQTELRNALAAFLFRGEDVFRPVSLLSGGERARLLLLQLMLARDNLLLLDEPTNHLDIASCEALEDALSGYDGTIFIVSHDRYFINRMADKVIRLTEDGCQIFPGNYDNYLEKFRELSAPTETQQAPPKENPYKLRKEQEAGKRRLLGRIRRCEEAVSAAEAEVEQLRQLLEQDDVMADYSRVLELTAQLDKKNRLVEQLMSEWEAMQLEAEEWEIV